MHDWDRRVCMLVWNEFLTDARVTKEAESLIALGCRVRVIAICTQRAPIGWDRGSTGIEIVRVPREVPPVARLIMGFASRLRSVSLLIRRLITGRQATKRWTEARQAAGERPRWDNRLVWLLEEAAVNLRMVREGLSFDPHVVHAHDANTLLPAWVASRIRRARLVYDAHELSTDREGYDSRVWMVRLVERWLGRAADARITTTPSRAEYFDQAYGLSDFSVLENRPRYKELERSDYLRRNFDIPDAHMIAVYQGGLQAGRGLHNLVRAISQTTSFHLVFVGGGQQQASLERLSRELDVDERVHFHPIVTLAELPTVTVGADVGMQTIRNTCLNHYTTDSNKLFEYIMAGIPVIASDFPEIRRIVRSHDVGILVDPDDVNGIATALATMRDDRAERLRYGANAEQARQACSWEAQERVLHGIYELLLSDTVPR